MTLSVGVSFPRHRGVGGCSTTAGEIVLEPLVELVGGLLLLGVAYAVGSVVFLLVPAARLSLGGLHSMSAIVDPQRIHLPA